MTSENSPIPTPTLQLAQLLQAAFDAYVDPVFMKDTNHRWIACNQAFCKMRGQPRELLIGRSEADFGDNERAASIWRSDNDVLTTGQPSAAEETIQHNDGKQRISWTRKFPIRNEQGAVVALVGTMIDVTELHRRQNEITQLQREISEQSAIVEMQRQILDEVTVPVIQLWNGILLLPLIGVIESHRAMRIMENLLGSISHASAQVVIIDITGVPVVDTSVARYLVRAVQSTRLLGCESILVGISPEIAQTLVGLGVDFSNIQTRATLQSGLEFALRRLNYSLQRTG
ncbi:MAG TPA: PAS domain-containing protein [Kouleothrix sp.]|nr:PAS domain-containing protein [Kouleothrix sp.]